MDAEVGEGRAFQKEEQHVGDEPAAFLFAGEEPAVRGNL